MYVLVDEVPPVVSPRVSRGVRCVPHGVPEYEYDIDNDAFSADFVHHLARHDGRRGLHRTSAAAPQLRHHSADTTTSPPHLVRQERAAGETRAIV